VKAVYFEQGFSLAAQKTLRLVRRGFLRLLQVLPLSSTLYPFNKEDFKIFLTSSSFMLIIQAYCKVNYLLSTLQNI